MAQVTEIVDLDSGVASSEATPEGQSGPAVSEETTKMALTENGILEVIKDVTPDPEKTESAPPPSAVSEPEPEPAADAVTTVSEPEPAADAVTTVSEPEPAADAVITTTATTITPTPNTDTTKTEKSEPSNSTVTVVSKPPVAAIDDDDDDDGGDIDESMVERLVALTEMFPEGLRKTSSNLVSSTFGLIKGSYSLTRQVVWIAVSTSVILFAPVMFELERLNVEEMMKQDRNRLVLGPGSAMSGGPPGAPGLMPSPPTR